jgi:hypothetical protein
VIDKDDKDKEEQQWDKEMAQVDRLLQKLPTYASAKPAHGGTPTPRSTMAVRPGGGSNLGAWMRVVLGLALAAGMALWPYSHVCGGNLFLYLGGVGTLMLAGLWSAVGSWQRRLAAAHFLSLLILLWGLVLAAGVALPRLGYAKSDAIWFCPEPVAPRSR